MPSPANIEDYLTALTDAQRAAIGTLRETIAAAAPMATETIAYGMPALRSHGGQFLVSFAAYKQHVSLFPASEAVVLELGEELTPYLAGKGTIRFPADRPIPIGLVRRVIAVRVAENAAAQHLKGARGGSDRRRGPRAAAG